MEATAFKINVEEFKKHLDGLTTDELMLLQSFQHSNTPDIVSAINFWRGEMKDAETETEKTHIKNMISRLKNLMEQRVLWTEYAFATYMPTLETGPIQEDRPDKEKGKVIDHPASKGKKKPQTVNEKLGKEKEEEQRKLESIKKANEKERESWPDFVKLYPEEEQQLESINEKLIPNVEKYLAKDDIDNARLVCRHHFRNFGQNIFFCTDNDIERFIDWLKSGKFASRSPLDVIKNDSLKIKDIIRETENLIIEGKTRKEVRNYLAEELMRTKIEGFDEILSTERDFIKFFRGVLQYLFDEDQQRRIKAEAEQRNETRQSVKQNLLEIHKDVKKDPRTFVSRVARDLKQWLATQGKEIDIKAAAAEVVAFVRSVDLPFFKEYTEAKKQKSNGGKKKDATEDNSGKAKEVDIDPKFNLQKQNEERTKAKKEKDKEKNSEQTLDLSKYEDYLNYKDRKSLLTEFLLTIMNKGLKPISEMEKEDDQVAALTKLANKRILELGLKAEKDGKKYDDWTEADVAKYMADEVIPFFTENYKILRSVNEKEFKKNLEHYLTIFPAGKEKERIEALTIVCKSKIPRSDYMKKVARKLNRGKHNDVNTIIAEINEEENLAAKKESE